MFAVADFTRHKDACPSNVDKPTCTDLPCTWNKPRKASGSVKICDIDARYVPKSYVHLL